MRNAIILPSCLMLLACSGSDPTPHVIVGGTPAAMQSLRLESVSKHSKTPKYHVTGSGAHKGEVDALVAPLFERPHPWLPALVIGITSPAGTEVYGYGNVGRPGKAKVPDQDTIFPVASITKTFTATLLAHLVEEKKVTLDEPVQNFFPPGVVAVPTWNGEPITLVELATHMSGLPVTPTNVTSTDQNNPFWNYTRQQLFDFVSSSILPYEPGTSWSYSNTGMSLLGYALAERTRVDYETLVRSRVTAPLSLKDTVFTPSREQSERFARGYDGDLDPIEHQVLGALNACCGLKSTVRDLLRYAAAEAKAGTTHSSSILDRAMVASQVPPFPDAGFQALGWFIYGDYIYHDGGLTDSGSLVAFDKVNQVAVALLFNTGLSYGDIPTLLGYDLLQMMAGQPYDSPITVPPTIPLPENTLDAYAGTWEANIGGQALDLKIYRDGDSLYLDYPESQWPNNPDYGHAWVPLRMYADSETSFYLRNAYGFMSFVADAQGTYNTLEWNDSSAGAPFALDSVEFTRIDH